MKVEEIKAALAHIAQKVEPVTAPSVTPQKTEVKMTTKVVSNKKTSTATSENHSSAVSVDSQQSTRASSTKKSVPTTAATPAPVTKDITPVVTVPTQIEPKPLPMVESETTARPKSTRRAKAVTKNTVNPLEIEDVIKKILVPNRDYGQIRGFNKPCLFKSGAERLLAYFGFTTRTELVACTEMWQDNFVSYTVKVTVMDRDGNELGNGYGNCNSRERRFARNSVFDAANCAIKLSVKRGICDAALRICSASFFLTQDVEDLPVDNPRMEAVG